MPDTEIDKTEVAEIDKAAALMDAQSDEGVQTYTFTKPVKVNGTTYTELKLDFDSLTGMDMEAIESALTMEGNVVPQVREFSKAYQIHVVARAARINPNDVRALPIKHVTSLTLLAQGFLMHAD